MAGPTEFDDDVVISEVSGADRRDLRSALVSLLASGDIEVIRGSSPDLSPIGWSRPLRLTALGQHHLTRS